MSNNEQVGGLTSDGVLYAKPPEQPKEAMRFTDDKMRFDLLPIEALVELTRVYDSGALKYNDNNWRNGMKWSQVYRPIFSHFFKWMLGQTVDKETGCHHLMMVAWNCMTLFVYQLRKLGTDDRASVGFAIDENFNWVDNHLGLGLSSEQKKELKEKYKQQREKAK